MMTANDLLGRLGDLHLLPKSVALSPRERADYDQAKEFLARAICGAQKTPVPPGLLARTAFRVATLWKVEITALGAVHQSTTMDVSVAGFTALLSVPASNGTEASCRLALKDGLVTGRAIVSGSQRTSTSSSQRVSFDFTQMGTSDALRLENALFDVVLANARRR
jgi:hypothetical protein